MNAHEAELAKLQTARRPTRRLWQILEPLMVMTVFLVGVVWIGGAYSNQDPWWFTGKFEERPAVIRVYHYGETRELYPGDPDFESLVAVVNQTIVRHAGYAESIHPNGASLTFYQTEGYAIELDYGRDVLVHTHYFFPRARKLMITLDGSYNYVGEQILFRGSAERWMPGGIVLKDSAALRAALAAALAQLAGN